MKVTLNSVGNPDHNQNPNLPMYGAKKNSVVTVKSFKEASEVCQKFIEDNDLGGGNWNGGRIFDDDGKEIAHVSYNGRVWEGKSWTPTTKEIEI